ncbi:MAG: peptidoglycan recognition protein family protein [Planctomycetota bacterium]|jgi:hypothetical protein|nr:peptidoglycan recognition protein family protein [Planctomycetota bacterium]
MDWNDEGIGCLGRRQFLRLSAAGAAALLLSGCENEPRAYAPPIGSRIRPLPPPAGALPPPPAGQAAVQAWPAGIQAIPAPAGRSGGGLTALSRDSWGATPALPEKMKPMNGVTRLTVHHEGSAKPNEDRTPEQAAATLRLIQSQHRKRLGAGDIGYHFIIDRVGGIWQGRDWNYQGAHASGANPHNLGIMLLGNFEIQQPTPAQLAALNRLASALVRKYRLNPASGIFGHCDFGKTQCPGKNLKPQVANLRRSLLV